MRLERDGHQPSTNGRLLLARVLCLTSIFTGLALLPQFSVAEESAVEVPTEAAGEAPETTAAPTSEELVASLSSDHEEERIAAVRALMELGEESSMGPLINTARTDPNPTARGWALRALHRIDTIEARRAIVLAARNDVDDRIRTLAIRMQRTMDRSPAVGARHSSSLDPQAVDAREFQRAVVLGEQEQRRERRRRRHRRPRDVRMIRAGWATFGITYGVSILTGVVFLSTNHEAATPLFVPLIGSGVAGQFIFADEDVPLFTIGMMAWLNAMFQTTSFIIALAGHRLRRNRNRRDRQRADRGITIAAGPGGQPGLSVAGWF